MSIDKERRRDRDTRTSKMTNDALREAKQRLPHIGFPNDPLAPVSSPVFGKALQILAERSYDRECLYRAWIAELLCAIHNNEFGGWTESDLERRRIWATTVVFGGEEALAAGKLTRERVLEEFDRWFADWEERGQL